MFTVLLLGFLDSFPTRRSSDLVWPTLMLAGAVYSPEVEIVPTTGLMLQVTPVVEVPETVARSEEHKSELKSREDGVCGIVTAKDAARVTVLLLDLVESANLVAV